MFLCIPDSPYCILVPASFYFSGFAIVTEAYDVCLGGRLGANAKFVRPISRKVPADKVKYALENLLREYKTNRKEQENFGQWVDRHANEELGEFMGLHLLAHDDPTWTPPPPRAHAPVGVE